MRWMRGRTATTTTTTALKGSIKRAFPRLMDPWLPKYAITGAEEFHYSDILLAAVPST